MENNMQEQEQDTNVQSGGGQIKQASKSNERKIEAYSSALINVVYSRETQPAVVGMLKGGDPLKSIPAAVLQINSMVESAARRGNGSNPDLVVILNSNILLTKELIDIGSAGGFFEVDEEQLPKILESTMTEYIKNGLANKTIDPIELQGAVEPLMNEGQRKLGMEAGAQTGVPERAGVEAAMETYAGQAVDKERGRISSQMASKPQGAMAQAQAQGQPQAQQLQGQPQGGQ